MTYLFDFDGTLVDSMPVYIDTMLQILKDYDIDYPADIVKIITPLGMKGTADYYQWNFYRHPTHRRDRRPPHP